jgi:hypothetical protein
MTPPAAAAQFLSQAGWQNAEILPLAGDASFRRYFRIVAPGRRAVLMDAPAPHEDPRPFLAVAEHLIGLGLSAPRTLAADLDHGLVLLEDFGDARMREVIDAAPEAELRIYTDAVDLLAKLHRHQAANLPRYDLTEYLREASLLTDWYAPALSLDVNAESYRAAWSEALAPVIHDHSVTVLRDYHAENIMLIEGREGIGALGLLDFQDAMAGHPAYDLVSMLQDARRDVSEAIETDMLNRYLEVAQPGQGFRDAYWLLGAQRNAKIVGIFTRLWKRDGKPRYLDYLPRVWAYLERDLAQPALAPVAAWFDANIPAERRGSAKLA